MNTPSKEALDAAENVQDYLGFPRRATMDLAAIIDRHFEPLRQRLAEMESLLASEKTTRNAIIAKGQQTEASVKELEAEIRRLEHENDGLERRRQYETDLVCAAVLEANARGVSFGSAELCSRVDELRALRATNAELAGALRHLKETLNRNGYATSDADAALARHAAGEPAKHPDTEIIDRFEEMCGSLEYCDADEVRNHWRAYGYSGSNEGVGRTMRDALRAAIDAAMQNG